MTCRHFLQLAVDIRDERDPAKRLRMLQALEEPARSPVLAWLRADSKTKTEGLPPVDGNTGG